MSLDDFIETSGTEKSNTSSHVPKDVREKYTDEEWLRAKIIDKNRTRKSVAKELGVSRETIQKWCERFNIKSGVQELNIELDGKELDIIIGNLLGDGSITGHQEKTASFEQHDAYKDYLEFIRDSLPSNFNEKEVQKRSDQDIYYIRSKNSKEFKMLRDEWYIDSEKTIPRGFRLNSDILKYWYICDGSLEKYDRPSISARWLSITDIIGLLEDMDSLGISKEHIAIKGPDKRGDVVFRFKNGSIKDFFKVIGDCPVESYEYKWPDGQ